MGASNGVDGKFLKPYSPAETEDKIYKRWEESGFFNPDNLPGNRTEPYSIVLPPPNVTGTLHIGHAEMLAIEDILIRFNRMRGKKTLWLPGTDHAAIATQSKVEGDIYKKEKKNRHDLGRDEFLKRVEQFAKESQDTIVHQLRKMGSSLDWSRQAFTLDEKRSRAVREAFKRMYDAGLIYRGTRIINWDPKGQTTVSDDEVVYEERPAKLVTFKYADDFPIPIATTRLETKLGDTAVAIHPSDTRYMQYVGKEYDVVFCEVPLHIKIIADESVDPSFGTGALGVTPAHSHMDAEIAKRHGLPTIQVVDEYARVMVDSKMLKGKKVAEAREIIQRHLKENGLLIAEDDIKQNVATAERSGGIIEPLPKLQWFVDVNKPIANRDNKTLKELMREPVEKGDITIIPDHFTKIYFHWINNLRDWCISRQIWYGHRIPVWYRGGEIYVGVEAPGGDGWEQDPDTLDTWFSSGLWTFSTLGWPEDSEDLRMYHPTNVLETGYDILFFWVARMILMTGFLLGDIPFRTVYLHGLIRDAKGQKMSKSLGNSIDPLDMVEKYGADATRISLIVGTTPGTDMKLSEDRVRGYKHFTNKIWNIARFVLSNTEDFDISKSAEYTNSDLKLQADLHVLVAEVTKDIEEYRLYMAAEKLYHYTWHAFADVIIEESKPILAGSDLAAAASRRRLLLEIFQVLLKTLHPFMPFVTEEIWSHLDKKDLLMVSPWPQ